MNKPLNSMLFTWYDSPGSKPACGVSEWSTLKLEDRGTKNISVRFENNNPTFSFTLINFPVDDKQGDPWIYKDFLTGMELHIYDL